MTWVDTLVGYMKRAAALLENLYAEQDQIIDQLRQLCARTHSLRHADFDALFGKVLGDRRNFGESVLVLVEGYRTGREAVVREVQEMFTSDMAKAASAWPGLKTRLGEDDESLQKIVAVLRQVHTEQESISAALSGLLMRGDKLKVDDLKTVAQRLAGRDSRESAELAALLGICESARLNAGFKWRRLAG
jgi:hypothetical protein